jgi:tRNA-dihydrouridine synthase
MSRTARDNSYGRANYSDAWIQSQANRITQLSTRDKKTYKSVEDKQHRMINILKKQREDDQKKQKLRRIANELMEIKSQLLKASLKYEMIERTGSGLDDYVKDLSTLKSINTLFEKI